MTIDLSSKCEASKQEANLRSEVESLTKENERLDEQLRKLRKEKLENQDYIE